VIARKTCTSGRAIVACVVRRVAVLVLIALIDAIAPRLVEAQLASCSLGTSSVSFGNYNPLSVVSLDTTGTVTFSCNVFALVPRLNLSRGAASTFNPRTMVGPGEGVLNYNLYLDAAHLVIWGDGTGGTSQFIAVGLVGRCCSSGACRRVRMRGRGRTTIR
jgi:spore coat protein U-like protein